VQAVEEIESVVLNRIKLNVSIFTAIQFGEMSHQASDLRSDHVIVIEPSKGWVPVRLRDLWEYRDLLYFLVWRDVNIRFQLELRQVHSHSLMSYPARLLQCLRSGRTRGLRGMSLSRSS
jgi:hypothetical protein